MTLYCGLARCALRRRGMVRGLSRCCALRCRTSAGHVFALSWALAGAGCVAYTSRFSRAALVLLPDQFRRATPDACTGTQIADRFFSAWCDHASCFTSQQGLPSPGRWWWERRNGSIADSRVVQHGQGAAKRCVDAERSAPRIAACCRSWMTDWTAGNTRTIQSGCGTPGLRRSRGGEVTLVAAGRCSACADLL